MQVYRLHEKIYHAKFEDQYGMCMTILRIHEHEENPVFKNKIFTFEQYMDWYVKNMGEGHFNFDKKILGFSIPGKVVKVAIKFSDEGFANGSITLEIPARSKTQKYPTKLF